MFDDLRLTFAPCRVVPMGEDEGDALVAAIVRQQIAVLKLAIRDAAKSALAEFERTTGLCPSHIDIEMVDTTVHERGPRFYIVGSVHLRFDESL
jgi:hypothetical protein